MSPPADRRPITALAALALMALSLLVLPGRARAWDGEADRLVGQLAYSRLDAPAKARVDTLLSGFKVAKTPCGAGALSDAPDLVECLKRYRDADFMRGVVYDPVPVCDTPAPPRPPCVDGRCASTVLRKYMAVLKDPAATNDARAYALIATTYLLSELHQPLHVADNNDRNGDRVRLLLPGSKRPATLYGVWDADMAIQAIGTAETGLPYARSLANLHGAAWAQGDLASWLAETHVLAVTVAYGRLPEKPQCRRLPDKPEVLTRDYFDVASPLVREQLVKAAVRLAAVLNADFG